MECAENAIAVTRSSMPQIGDYMEEITPLWESRWLTNSGHKHQELEELLQSRLDVGNVALFTNGHAALEAAFEALDLHGKVITTPFTFASTTHAIVRKGLEPVFADVKPDDFTLDPAKVEGLISEDVCAIAPVHVYGNLCDVDAIQDIAKRHNLKVIYDAAHAFGVEKNGVSAACFGDISMFSFHATKVFNTIEGGALCFSDSALKLKLEQYRNFGIASPEDVPYIGGNAKMNEFCAAMGICNLRHLDEEIAKRRQAVERYRLHLDRMEGVTVCTAAEGVRSNYAYMPVIFEPAFGASRDDVMRSLDAAGVKARKYFYPLVSDFACYAGQFDSSLTPVAQEASSRVLVLPLYAGLSLVEVDRTCEIIEGCSIASRKG